MLAFYGDKISQNRIKTPEGYLIIKNCPLARTGTYEYLASELGIEGSNDIVNVFRPPEEVFNIASIASFNGKSATNNHPPVLLDARNNGIYEKGTVINVRQGKDNESDLLLGDLIIKDPQLIDEIESGRKKEISCGYDCIYEEDGNGNFIQRQIRGNHVAIVENGRAGSRVAVKDNSTTKISNMEGEKKKMSKIKFPKRFNGPISNVLVGMGLKSYVQDAEPHEIAEAVDALAEEREDAPVEKAKDAEAETPAEQAKEDQGIAALSEKVDQLAGVVQKCMEMMQGSKDEKPEDAIDQMIEELGGQEVEGNAGDQEESVTVPVEEMQDEDLVEGEVTDPSDRPKNPIANADSIAMIKALKAMKPVIAAIKDPKERKKACDSLMVEFKKANKTKAKDNGYQKILDAQKINSKSKAQKATDSQDKRYDEIQNAYAAMNSHNRNKGVK